MEDRVKYPRTRHLPFSPGATPDDEFLVSFDGFKGRQVVITEKMDGENTTIYPDGYCHARSVDSGRHESRGWIKRFAAQIGPEVDSGTVKDSWRITGENLYAKHSIYYQNLKSYFYMFGFWENDICLEWNYTRQIAQAAGITLVNVLYEGVFDELIIKALPQTLTNDQEGFVIRVKDNIYPSDWDKCVAKWVRPNHVRTSKHWMFEGVIKNKLGGDK